MVDLFDDIKIVRIIEPRRTIGGISEEESAEILGRVDALELRPNITHVHDIPDVNGTPVDRNILVFDDATDTWVMEPQELGVHRILTGVGDLINGEARGLHFWAGLEAYQDGTDPELVRVRVVYAGTGSSVTAARSDHTHQIKQDSALNIAASGTLSTGTRTLISQTISGLDDTRNYIIKGDLDIDLQGEGTGAGYSTLSVTIDGNSRTRNGQVRTVSGVPRSARARHPGVIVTGKTSIVVSAAIAFQPGDPINVGAGELHIEIESNR